MDTLDIPELQILVEYPDDPNDCFWHHRTLVKKVGEYG